MMNLFKTKSNEIASLIAVLTCIALALMSGCENKPVVNEAMDEDGKPGVEEGAVKSTNIETEGDDLKGMPEDTENVLPGAQ